MNTSDRQKRGGDVQVAAGKDGRWTLAVDHQRPATFMTLEAALDQAGRVMFAPGESPGEWRVHVNV